MRQNGARALGAMVAALLLCCVPLAAGSDVHRRSEPAIKLGRSIVGVEPGMTAREVRRRLGPPQSVDRDPPRSRRYDVPIFEYRYQGGRLTVAFPKARGHRYVWRVRTHDRRHRTATDLGVGSSERTLRRRLRGEFCLVKDGRGRCLIDRGIGVTFFRLVKGRVEHVSVSLIRRAQ